MRKKKSASRRDVSLGILTIGMMFSSGCATDWARNGYGRAPTEYFHTTGPVRGDAAQIYIHGELHHYPYPDTRKQLSPAYIVIELQEGQIISKEIHKGNMPPVAFEYPRIWMPPYDKASFIASGQDVGYADVTEWYLYVKNPNDINNPHWVDLTRERIQYPRSDSSEIFYPVVLTGAVVSDVIAAPVYVVFVLGVYLLIPFVGL